MSIKIRVKNSVNQKSVKNFIFFTNQDFKIKALNKLPVSQEANLINKSILSNKIKNKDFLFFNINADQKVILIKVENDVLSLKNEKRGAKFYNFIKSNSFMNLTFFEENIKELNLKNKHFFDEFIHGLELKSYTFNKYKTKKEKKYSS